MNVAGKYCIMSENTAVKIGNIHLGSIAKQIDQKAEFREAFWEEHIDATLKGIRELKHDIVRALRKFQPEIGRGNNGLGCHIGLAKHPDAAASSPISGSKTESSQYQRHITFMHKNKFDE